MPTRANVKRALIDSCAYMWLEFWKKKPRKEQEDMILRLLRSAGELMTIAQLEDWKKRIERWIA